MRPNAVWHEMCWLLCVEEMDNSMRQAFELVQGSVEPLLPRTVSHSNLTTNAARAKLNRELNSAVNLAADAFAQACMRESTRLGMLLERLNWIDDALMAQGAPRKAERVLSGLARFLKRFRRFRLKLLAEKHLPPDGAKDFALGIDLTPDPYDLRDRLEELRGLPEQEMVAGLLRGTPPTILQKEALIIVAHPQWSCRLEYASRNDAETAISGLKARYAQDKPVANKLRSDPTIPNLLSFLGRALPAGQLMPSAISIAIG